MANTNDSTQERAAERVSVKANIPVDLDQELEIEVAKQRPTTKSQFIEDAIRAHIKSFKQKRGAA